MKRRAWGVVGLVGSAALLASCFSGQTGSADCAPRPLSCVCDALSGKSLVRAKVLAVDEPTATLEIEQVLNPNTLLGEQDVQRQVVGTVSTGTACESEQRAFPKVGDTVFATFFPYDNGNPIHTEILLLPEDAAASTVDIGDGTSAPIARAAALSDPDTCSHDYPGPPWHCNDTNTCAVARAPGGAPSFAWLAALLVGLASLRLRRRR